MSYKSFKQILKENFYDATNIDKNYVETFINPTNKEYQQVKSDNDSIRGFFFPNGDMLVFNSYNAIHSQIYTKINIPKDSIPFMTVQHEYNNAVDIMITDEITTTKWWDEENDTVTKECIDFIWNDSKYYLIVDDVDDIILFNGEL